MDAGDRAKLVGRCPVELAEATTFEEYTRISGELKSKKFQRIGVLTDAIEALECAQGLTETPMMVAAVIEELRRSLDRLEW